MTVIGSCISTVLFQDLNGIEGDYIYLTCRTFYVMGWISSLMLVIVHDINFYPFIEGASYTLGEKYTTYVVITKVNTFTVEYHLLFDEFPKTHKIYDNLESQRKFKFNFRMLFSPYGWSTVEEEMLTRVS